MHRATTYTPLKRERERKEEKEEEKQRVKNGRFTIRYIL